MASNGIKWTAEQNQAIESRGKNLLVSASAGSGKTTVMIERIISLMMSEQVPIKDFLVVTFTKASASDMKRKLINKLLELSPTDWVLEQIENVQTSDISNLHSFCSRLVSIYFYKAQVDPAYHVIDETESKLLKEKAADKLFEEKEKNDGETYFKLFEIFQKKRKDDGLKNAIFKLNDFLNSILGGREWLRNRINETYNLNLNTNECARIINNYVCKMANKDAELADAFAKKAESFGCEKYYQHFTDIASSLRAMNISKSFLTNAKVIFDMSFAVSPRVSDEHKFLSEEASFVKNTIKKHLINYQANFVSSDEKELVAGLKFGREVLTEFLDFCNEFDEIYLKLKKEINGLDFNDLEKYALEILSDPAILADVKERYKYVFVDEYQDINEVQEKIISLISGENNRFMVGDIKQSIYRFRFCDPDIFLGTYHKFLNGSMNDEVVKLNCNFRSDKKILKFVDMVFSGVMTDDFGGIDYEKESQFVPGESNLDLPNSVNLCFIDTEKPKAEKQSVSGVYSVKNHVQEDDDEDKKAIAEAVYVANKIAELTSHKNPNRMKYEDIAILVQSRNETTAKFLQTLGELGIPVSSDEKYDITKQTHIDEILSFVKLCVNSKDDILMFKVLKSKLFNFSDNELVKLRKLDMRARFFDCVYFYEKLDDENLKQKTISFVNDLNRFHELAKSLDVKIFVAKLIDEFKLKQINFASIDGMKKVAEIEALERALPQVYPFEFVSNFENFSLEMQNESGEDAVKFMSIHASKGIEFKAVFLCNTSKPFAMMSLSGDFLLSKQLGVGLSYFNMESRSKGRSLPLSAISLIEKRKLVEENQRVLYVALTRSIEKLFVVCSKSKSSLLSEFPEHANSFVNWFEPIIVKELDGEHDSIINFEEFDESELLFIEEEKPQQLLLSSEKQAKPQKFVYDFESSTKIPLKNSVSKIIQSKENKLLDSDVDFDDEYEIFENVINEEKLKSFAERGTAYHKVFESLDLKHLENIDEKLYQIKSNILTEKQAQMVDEVVIKKVLNLSFFKEIKPDDVIIKEREFFANLQTSILNNDEKSEDSFILQGVIDLLIVRNNKLILLDYKTGSFSDEKLEKYKFQLEMYADVASRAFELDVEKKYICFVDLQKILEI